MKRHHGRLAALTLALAALAPTLLGGHTPVVAAQEAATRTTAQLLTDARQAELEGRWEDAIRDFTVASDQEGSLRLVARLELAQLYDTLGRYGDAETTLRPLVAQGNGSPAVLRGWFLLGSVLADLRQPTAAAEAYARYIESGGAAAPFARVERARVLLNDDPEAALTSLGSLIDGRGPLPARRSALRIAGQIEENAGRLDAALARYVALRDITVATADRAQALAKVGSLRHRLGDSDGAAEAYATIVSRLPTTPEAETALTQLETLGRPASGLERGIVEYRRRRNAPARESLLGFLRDASPTPAQAAQASFFLGLLADRRGDVEDAIDRYEAAYQADPAGPLAGDALWERAGTLDIAERSTEARQAYLRIGEAAPTSRYAGEGRMRAAWLAYAAGAKAEARATWQSALTATDSATAARAGVWAARVANEQGDSAAARAALTEAARRDPTGYYGLRAGALLAGQPAAPDATLKPLAISPADWRAAEAWLTGWAGPENRMTWQAVLVSEDWRGALELIALGWQRSASDTVRGLIDQRAKEPWTLYRLARALADAGANDLAAQAAARLMNQAPSEFVPGAIPLRRLEYPAPWSNLVRQYTEEFKVDPLLLYALMRQESAFNPTAGSSAGAFGLTQVIPITADEIARGLGLSDFAFSDLARPYRAIQFGSYYLAGQLRYFNGNTYRALAAYNGGAGNVNRWSRSSGANDNDAFYEAVDFTETRLYLRLVLENYAWYRYLYAGAPQPTLLPVRP